MRLVGKRLSCLMAAAAVSLSAAQAQAVTVQNFDGGGTAFTVGGVTAVSASAGTGGSAGLRITPPLGFSYGVAAFDRSDIGAFETVLISLSFRFHSPTTFDATGGADGIGVALLNTATYGTTGLPGAINNYGDVGEEPNVASAGGGFAVGIDNHDNGGEGNHSVSLHYNGALIASVDVSGTINTENAVFNDLRVLLDFVPGGALVDVTLVDGSDASVTMPFNNFFIAGLTPYESRLALGGRTGGLNLTHDVDNVEVLYRLPILALPEPASASLLALAGLTLLRRRRIQA